MSSVLCLFIKILIFFLFTIKIPSDLCFFFFQSKYRFSWGVSTKTPRIIWFYDKNHGLSYVFSINISTFCVPKSKFSLPFCVLRLNLLSSFHWSSLGGDLAEASGNPAYRGPHFEYYCNGGLQMQMILV